MAKDQLSKKVSKVVVIGGSAGALSVVLQVIQRLDVNMNLAGLVVLHRKPSDENVLADVLSARTSYEVREIEDKDELSAGVIYVAPADYHVLVESDGSLTLDDSEKVNFSRPSIDVSFESAADAYGSSLVGVLLSGANADGVAGLERIKARGGKVVIQDPAAAEFSYMPKLATERMIPDLLLTEKNIDILVDLLSE
ncbi:MAG TPA: chemotaxis protein CheB [Cyclobacteriaceae bacterium]